MDIGHTGQIHDILLDQVEWTLVRITDRVKWRDRCDWIESNAGWYQDHTNWGMWDLGLADIEYYVPRKHAIIYYLIWL